MSRAVGSQGHRGRRQGREQFAALAWGRVKRAVQRQLPTFLLATAIVATLGVLYEIGVRGDTGAALPKWLGLAAAAALAVAAVAELGRNTITSLSSLGRHRGYAVLGAAPELTSRTLRQLPPDLRSPLGCLAHAPASPFATAFRDLQGALVNDRLAAVISTLPGDGATTVALCTAISAAQQGRRVVVLDCDLRRRDLTRSLGLDPEFGVLEAAARPEYWRDYVQQEDETGLHFIPAARPPSAWRTLSGAAGFTGLLKFLQDDYDLVVLDCPPALASADGPMIARLADRCVVVAVWDQTPLAAIRAAMRALRLRARAVGVYVNRVPPGYRFGRLRPD